MTRIKVEVATPTERPILFSAAMILALLDGRKTQTRRPLKPQPISTQLWGSGVPNSLPTHFCVHARFAEPYPAALKPFDVGDPWLPCPYGKVGDRLWCRETWCNQFDENGSALENSAYYRADGTEVRHVDGDGLLVYCKDGSEASPWRPSIFMPRWASRITLEITDIRTQRLHDLSEADALAEGLTRVDDGERLEPFRYRYGVGDNVTNRTAVAAYAHLWDSLNKSRGYGWDTNPWVWVLTFRRVETGG